MYFVREHPSLPPVVDLFHDRLDCTLGLFGLTFFLEILGFLLQN